MEVLITLIFILVVLLVGVTLIGHGIWVLLAWFLRQLSGGQPRTSAPPQALNIPPPIRCLHCQAALLSERKYCLRCGASRPSDAEEGLWRELGTTLSQLDRLHKVGVLDANTFRALKTRLEQERERIAFPRGRPGSAEQPPTFTHTTDIRPVPPTPRQTSAVPPKLDEPRRPTTFPPQVVSERPPPDRTQEFGAWATDSDEVVLKPPLLKPPRRPFAEVMAAFMEQSNIRWGEIIGGLLIVGCSTALVVSLWAQIASIPVLKFLIFTSVTAALFGVGFYTEHRWKLPTTSGGILTIAVLLVPLNFLAIAAASGGTAPTSALVIASEIIAPSLFLCLVYFAGRVITSLWPHVLAASVLGSSIGQLLIRHFGSPQSAPLVLIALGAFPVVCYVTAAAWMLKQALADKEINEAEANQIFVTLSAITFAAALPFGLLLYSSGPPGMSMIHLAPVVTLAGTPMLAGGAILWRRILRPDLAAARTAGTSIALLGTAVVLSGMFLGWPNPASLVPAALLNFVVFTAVAVWLNLPSAHVFAAGCLSFAYIVTFQIFAGHVPWQNPRAVSLLDTTISANTGRALLLPFVLFTLTSEWLTSKARPRDSTAYFQAACGIAVVSLALLTAFGISLSGDPFHIWIFFGLYTAGAFWFAWRSRSVAFTWIGAALLLLTSAQICGPLLSVEFRWQATFLLFAAVSITGALMFRRYGKHERQGLLVLPLVRCAIPGALVATLLLLANMILHEGEPALVLATRTFFLAAIWSGLLVLAGAPVFFTALQTTLALGLILSTRYFLQRVDWYGHQPDVWLHPWALQIQGIVLGLFCLTWTSIRLIARRRLAGIEDGGIADAAFKTENEDGSFDQTLRRILDLPLAFDHLLSGTLVTGFTALIVFGAASGISQELTNLARTPQQFDLLGYPHGQILQYG
ncbi:MAG: hypothetical protein QOK48_2544, partial [Blastocatellia bacterium]|nr:hypothetical protein [Blastocatellia bacterium]